MNFRIDFKNMSSKEIINYLKSIPQQIGEDKANINIKKEYPTLVGFENELNKLQKEKYDLLFGIISLKDKVDELLKLIDDYHYSDEDILKLEDNITKEEFKNKMNMKIDSHIYQIEHVRDVLKLLQQYFEFYYYKHTYMYNEYNDSKQKYIKKLFNK